MVCGDHGMSDQGGHGGATESEIRVPVIFLKIKDNRLQDNQNGIRKRKDMNRKKKELM